MTLRQGKKGNLRVASEAINLLSVTKAVNDYYGTAYSFEQVQYLMDNELTTVLFILAHRTETDKYYAEQQKKRAPKKGNRRGKRG